MVKKNGSSARAIDLSATNMVYENLRARILKGELAGGTLLVEQDVAQAMQVSRTPVHEALRRLGAEGLLDISPRRRARVADVSLHDIEQLFSIRGRLESLGAEDAAREIDEPAIRELEAATDQMEAVTQEWSAQRLREFIEANNRFHIGILAASQNRWLARTLRPVLDMLLGPLNTLALHPVSGTMDVRHEFLVRNCRQHREIIDALRAGNAAWAGAAMNLHVQTAHRDWGGAAEVQRQTNAVVRKPRRRRAVPMPALS